MKILLLTEDLMTRTRLESRWRNAGAEILRAGEDAVPELVVVDLTGRDALAEIGAWRERAPAAEVLAFGPHVDGAEFKAAKAAGATALVARGKVLERVLRRLG